MSSFAEGKRAFGFCDRTGFRYPLKDLVPQIVNGRDSGLRVGRDVVDEDQPQYKLGQIRVGDAQALRNPRPPKALANSRKMFAFDPVGGGITELGSRTVGLDIHAEVGKVTVSTS